MKKFWAAALSLLTVVGTLFSASCEMSKQNRDGIYYEDFTMEMTIPKAEYTVDELIDCDYKVNITLKFTNATGEDLYYDFDDSDDKAYGLFYYGRTGLITHKNGVRYEIGSIDSSIDYEKFTVENFFSGNTTIPSKIAADGGFTVNMVYDFSSLFLAEDGEAAYSYFGVGILDETGEIKGVERYQPGESFVTYNTDFALSDDENYKDLGTDEYYIFGTSDYSGEITPIVSGYYSLVINGTMYVNCIKITE